MPDQSTLQTKGAGSAGSTRRTYLEKRIAAALTLVMCVGSQPMMQMRPPMPQGASYAGGVAAATLIAAKHFNLPESIARVLENEPFNCQGNFEALSPAQTVNTRAMPVASGSREQALQQRVAELEDILKGKDQEIKERKLEIVTLYRNKPKTLALEEQQSTFFLSHVLDKNIFLFLTAVSGTSECAFKGWNKASIHCQKGQSKRKDWEWRIS
eukprot:g16385.t1